MLILTLKKKSALFRTYYIFFKKKKVIQLAFENEDIEKMVNPKYYWNY